MRLDELLSLFEQVKESIPEATVEYFRKPQYGYDKQGRANLAVRLSQLSLLTTKNFKLEEFWRKQDESKLVEQFIKATFKLGKEYGIYDGPKKDFETYQYIIDNLFSRNKQESDIIFYMEPGFDFKGSFKGEKFSIAKIKHDEGEAETGKWAHKEKKELEKLK